MGKLYTLDGKLLTETPEIRVGEKIYQIGRASCRERV